MIDIKAIKRRYEAATEGPWEWQKFGKEHLLTGQWGMRPIILAHYPKGEGETCLTNRDAEKDLLIPLSPEHPDSQFIAHSRQDIPDLIEEVEKLRTELDAAEARCLELADELNEANW